ncbi:MAG: hypothetical protein ABFD50_08075 [Smithella sp.]
MLQTSILRLLKSKGVTGTLRRSTIGAYVPGTGSPAPSYTNYSITLAVIDYKDSIVPNNNIQIGDRKALIAGKGLSVVPRNQDFIIYLGTTYKIIQVHTIRENANVVAYICQVRV